MNNKKLFLFLFLSTSPTFLLAQGAEDELASAKNIIKLNLPALALKNISLQYERAIAKKVTIAGSFRFMPKGGPPSNIGLAISLDRDRKTKNLKVSNVAFMPEVRYYFGKKGALRGFYLGLFANIAKYNGDFVLEYEDASVIGKIETIQMSGSVTGITGGLMIGAQFKLSKQLYLDWWILGPNYGSSNGKVSGQKIINASEQQSLRDKLAEIDVPITNFTYEVNGIGAAMNFKGPLSGLRPGICIGFRF